MSPCSSRSVNRKLATLPVDFGSAQCLLWPLAYVAVGVKAVAPPEPGSCPRCGAGPMVPAGEVPPTWLAPVGAPAEVDSS